MKDFFLPSIPEYCPKSRNFDNSGNHSTILNVFMAKSKILTIPIFSTDINSILLLDNYVCHYSLSKISTILIFSTDINSILLELSKRCWNAGIIENVLLLDNYVCHYFLSNELLIHLFSYITRHITRNLGKP